jgi:hypothetical protein
MKGMNRAVRCGGFEQPQQLGDAVFRAGDSTRDRIKNDTKKDDALTRPNRLGMSNGETEELKHLQCDVNGGITLFFCSTEDEYIVAITTVFDAALTQQPRHNREHEFAQFGRGVQPKNHP